jgi:hypothetical protein
VIGEQARSCRTLRGCYTCGLVAALGASERLGAAKRGEQPEDEEYRHLCYPFSVARLPV